MRIVWADSKQVALNYKYRKYNIERYKGGWVVDFPGDNNIYVSVDCASNAIDKALGGYKGSKAVKRRSNGIKIIGVREQSEQKTS